MSIYRNLAMPLAIGLFSLLITSAHPVVAQSDKNETEFTLGCLAKTDCWSSGVIDSSIDVVCKPISKPTFDDEFYNHIFSEDVSFNLLCSDAKLPCFTPYTQEEMDSDVADKLGDTVTIIWPGGSCKGVIDNIGLSCSIDGIEPICQIQAINNDLSSYSYDDCFAVVQRQKGAYNDSLIKYHEYKPSIDENLRLLLDSLVYDEAKAWVKGKVYPESLGMAEIRNTKGQIRYAEFIFYSRNIGNFTPDTIKPDTFYCDVMCCGNLNIHSLMMYRLIRIGNIYKAQPLFDDYGLAREFRLLYMFDANNDGKMEYIVSHSQRSSITFEIYGEKAGKWIRLFESCNNEQD